MSFSRKDRVMLQFNRVAFKLEWLRNNFPGVPIIHIYREPEKQWNSIVKRVQSYYARDDVGQDSVDFNGMGMANWCNHLQEHFPELRAEYSLNGYERFLKLYGLSLEQHRLYTDLSVRYEDLITNIDEECKNVFDLIGYQADIKHLSQFIVPPSKHRPLKSGKSKAVQAVNEKIDMLGSYYARAMIRFFM